MIDDYPHAFQLHYTPSGGKQPHCPCGFVGSVYSTREMALDEYNVHLDYAKHGVTFQDASRKLVVE